MMLWRVEPRQEELFLLVFILVFYFFLYLQQLSKGNAVAVARKTTPKPLCSVMAGVPIDDCLGEMC